MTSKKINYYNPTRRELAIKNENEKSSLFDYFNGQLIEDKKIITNNLDVKLIENRFNRIDCEQVNHQDNYCKQDTIYQDSNHFIYFKIMFILILFFVSFLFCSALNSINSDNSHLDNSSFKRDNFIAERYSSFNSNNNLFYDLTFTGEFDYLKKPSIYFQFITNKPSTKLSLNNNLIKHSNKKFNRHDSKSIAIHTQSYLLRFMLNNDTVKCNDGTDAGYYFRKARNSKKWIIFLEGGWFCYSTLSCYQRWTQMRGFMSSAHWPEKRLVNGILSNKKDENLFYYDVNHVYLPYCSSDLWSGDKPGETSKDLHFSGSKIIENVIKDLAAKGLRDANLVYIAGSSAGGTGVLINLDKIANLITSINLKTIVNGLVDSGWFLDNEPFKSSTNNFLSRQMNSACLEGQLCSPIESVKKGFEFWNSKVSESCANEYPNEQWRCFFGPKIYATLKTQIFVIQWLFDEAQMAADNVGLPSSKAHWHYIYKLGLQLRNSLKNVTGVFAPSCISHTMLIKKNWNQFKINGISLPEAIHCWESKQNSDKKLIKSNYLTMNLANYYNSKVGRQPNSNTITNEVDIISPLLHSSNYHYSSVFNLRESNSILNKFYNRRKKIRRRQFQKSKSRLRNDEFNLEKCSIRLVDECSIPQYCNSNCPPLKNVFTGKVINFVDLLKAFGLKL